MGSYEMMEKWINKFQKEWEQKLELLDETTRDVAKQIDKENNNRYSYNTMDNSEEPCEAVIIQHGFLRYLTC